MITKSFWTALVLCTCLFSAVRAQEKNISGTVTDQNGLPLPGVSVVVANTSNGTQTDFDGNYQIRADMGQVLQFSYIGQKTVQRTIGNSVIINVQMEDDAQALDEVVVIAYGSQSEKGLVTSISRISQESIEDIVTDSPQDLLQGQASGVQVVSSSGLLGAAPEVRIRGTSSIGTNSRPLFVIDGVVLGDDFQTEAQGGAQGLNPLASINPNDIESISVLKSASAAALYGSRGANGVVLITTKSGSTDGTVKVTFDVSTSFSNATDLPDLLNAEQYLFFQNEIVGLDLTDNGADFDFLDAVVNTAISKSYNLGISGGDEKLNYFISGTRSTQEGIIIGNELERTSFRANIKTQANNWLTAGINMSVNNNRFDRTPTSNAFASPYTIANLQRPDIAPYDDDGNFTTAGNVGGGNVIAQETLNLNLSTTTRITGNAFAELDFSSILFEGLKFKQDFGVDRNFTENQEREIDLLTPGGFAENNIFQQNRYISTSTLTYDTVISGKHNISLLTGFSYDQNDSRDIQVEGTGFLADSFINVDSASTFPTTLAGATGSRLVSYFGRATFDFFNGKYLLESSIRRDGSSRFGANNQFGSFWSVATGWNIADENFMKNVSWVNVLKLTAGVGTAGNDRIGNFASLGTFFNSNYNGESGLRQNTLDNPDLRWESTTSYDLGLSTSLFNNRLSLGVEVYKRITDDLILFVPLDPTFNIGLNGRNENIGKLENRGIDIDVSSKNVSADNFKWTTSLNLGFNTNEVTSLPESSSVDELGNKYVVQGGFSDQRAILGHSANSFYLIPFLGINRETGDAEWLDADGNPTTAPVQADRRIVGKANPDLVGGLTNNFTYKNWTLNTFLNFSFGNDIYVSTRQFSENPFSVFQKTTRVLNVWQQPGDNAFIPSPDSSTFNILTQDSSRYLEDGSFIRLKNVTLAYSVPREVLDDFFINNLRFYITGTNLITFKSDNLDGIDPEVSRNADGAGSIGEDFFNLPQASTYTLGINIGF